MIRMFCALIVFCFLGFLAIIAQEGESSHKEETIETHAEKVTDGKHEKTDDHAKHGDTAHDDHSHHAPGAYHLDGKGVSLWWCLPFIGILLSIALFPLVAPHFWHHHYGKISLTWGLIFLIPFAIWGNGGHDSFNTTMFYILEVYILEFIPFIVLLMSLFAVTGGIALTGTLRGSPKVNTILLGIGVVVASWMGTTGAAMLLIRPVLKANAWRKKKVHVVVFFIFLVANIGGSLTPLGDPPLFLGFLKGVSFFWTTTALFIPYVIASVILLAIFFVVDKYFYDKEDAPPFDGEKEPLGIQGLHNFILLAGVVGAVVLSGVWKSKIIDPVTGKEIVENILLDLSGLGYAVKMSYGQSVMIILLVIITVISMLTTKKSIRELNGFTWEPILEVAKLFATIFITMVPAIAILKAGEAGALKAVINSVMKDGQPVNEMFFWATGILSSFLDNAPTYVVFFETASGDAVKLMGEMKHTLAAISMGAVFMGANTYIGNAPNFMVKAIAEESGVKMPSFFGYMVWTLIFLIPTFMFLTLIKAWTFSL